MNYHLMIDNKFIDDFIVDAEKYAPGNNVYLVSLYTKKPQFTKSPLITYVKSVKKYWFRYIAPHLKENDRVFIHWLDRRVYDIVLALPKETEVGLFGWMGDLIATPTYRFDKEILKPESYAFFNRYKKYRFESDTEHGRIYNFLLFLRHIWRIVYAPAEWRRKKRVMQRLNLFFHWNEFDYQWVKKHYPRFNARLVYFMYDVGLSSAIASSPQKKNDGMPFGIWLGNSATVSNNHFEALDAMAHLKEENIEIFCPLSYGEKPDSEYTRCVIERGQRIFGTKFKPLLSYLNRDDYYALFRNVQLVVMNHIRSQAAGNVFMFFKLGKIIFMDEKSTLYQFLCSKNAKNIRTVNDLSNSSFDRLNKTIDIASASSNIGEEILDAEEKARNMEKYLT